MNQKYEPKYDDEDFRLAEDGYEELPIIEEEPKIPELLEAMAARGGTVREDAENITITIPKAPKQPEREELPPLVAVPQAQQLKLFSPWFSPEKNRTLPEADTIGRYVLSRRKNLWGTKATLERIFPTKNGKARMKAAILDGGTTILFPGGLEQLIELVLRKMTLEQQAEMWLFREKSPPGFHHISVAFTIYDLRRRLAEDGHERSVRDIREALQVMDGCNWSIEAPLDREFVGELRGPILRIQGVKKTKQSKGEGKKEMYLCYWHPLIAEEILSDRGLLVDAGITKIKDPLARWAAHRLNARYRQAGKNDWINEKGYTISLATILQESGIEAERRIRDTLERIRKAWEELQDAGFLSAMKPYTESLEMEATARRPKITGATWILHPGPALVDTIIQGNKEKRIGGEGSGF
jgi:hypothetical protein